MGVARDTVCSAMFNTRDVYNSKPKAEGFFFQIAQPAVGDVFQVPVSENLQKRFMIDSNS